MDENKKNLPITLIAIVGVVLIAIGIFYFSNDNTSEITEQTIKNSETENLEDKKMDNLDTESRKQVITEVLNILSTIHLVSIDTTKTSEDPNMFLYEEMRETMDDIKRLEGLSYKIESLRKSEKGV